MRIPLKVDEKRLEELSAVYDRVLQGIPDDGCPHCGENADYIVVGTIDISYLLYPSGDDGWGRPVPRSVSDHLNLNFPSSDRDCDWHVDCENCGYTLDANDFDDSDLRMVAQSLKVD